MTAVGHEQSKEGILLERDQKQQYNSEFKLTELELQRLGTVLEEVTIHTGEVVEPGAKVIIVSDVAKKAHDLARCPADDESTTDDY